MSDEKRTAQSEISPAINRTLSASVSSTLGTPTARFRRRMPLVTAVVFCAGGSVVAGVAGMYGLAVVFAILACLAFVQIVKIKTNAHEMALSESLPLKSLRDRLGSLALEPALHTLSARAQTQLERIDFGLKQATQLLNQKLDSGELAYSRFRASLDDAGHAGFSQLQDAVALLNQASLVGGNNPQAEAAKGKATALLDENEKFLESLATATGAIAAMETNSARVELPQAMKELEQIASRAKNLSIKTETQ